MFFTHLKERYQVVVPPTIRGLIQKLCVILILAIFCVHAGAQTGTFIDKQETTNLRVVSYNILRNKIIPSVNHTQAEKFERVTKALEADIWCFQELDNGLYGDEIKGLLDQYVPLGSDGCQLSIPGTQIKNDMNGPEGVPDCRVDLFDFAFFASEWLDCTDLNDLTCFS